MDEFKVGLIVALVVIFALLVVVDLLSPQYGFFARVDSGYVGIVTHFGKIEDRVLPAGFHVTSYFEHVNPLNVRTQIHKTELVAFSADIQQVKPRVLTFDELLALKFKCVWYEQLDTHEIRACRIHSVPFKDTISIFMGGFYSMRRKNYGIKYRCWTGKPQTQECEV